jgi:diguanylate cyclase (GGDEF)-like protein/PAS domain S-box-containing protein
MARVNVIGSFLRSMPGRMISGLLLTNLILGSILIVGVMHFVRQDYQAQFVNNVRSQAYTIATLIGQDTSRARVDALLADIRLGGQVIYVEFSETNFAAPAANGYKFKEDFFFGEDGDGSYSLAVPITDSAGIQRGTLRLSYDETYVTENIKHLYHLGFVLAFVYMWTLLLITATLSLRLTNPLTQLQRKSREVASGQLHQTLSVASKLPEIVSLANDLEFMRQQLVRHGEEITAQESRYRTILENLTEGVIIINPNCQIENLNPAAQRMFGYSFDEALGVSFYQFSDDESLLLGSCATLLGGRAQTFNAKRKNGETFPMQLSITSFQHGDKKLMAAVVQDISERKAYEDNLTVMAYYDPLTGLPNRRLFHDRLTQAVAQAERHSKLIAIFFLDLDRFKSINDTLGHETGDQLLQAVADRLTSVVRKCDTVARLGGDEFTVLLDEIANVQEAEVVAQKIIESFAMAFMVGGQELFISTSIGITVYPFDANNIDTLVKNADTAMYHAKQEGRNNYQLYASEMNATAAEKLNMENALRKAVVQNDLRLYYQPQIQLHFQPQVEQHNGEIIGAEALVRWEHPELGLIYPDRFIPLAEESGLIIPLGEWVLRTACEQNKAWQAAGLPPMSIAVNLSPRQLQHPKLVAQIEHLLKVTGLDPAWLELEITESMILHNTDKIIGTLHDIKRMGIRISIDDFGTGHSSLSNLQRLPVDSVKIDRSFVRNITSDPNDAAIAVAVIEMAHNMGLRVIAEGVETWEQMAFLQAHKCNVMQGFYFSKAVPVNEFEALVLSDINARNPLRLE